MKLQHVNHIPVHRRAFTGSYGMYLNGEISHLVLGRIVVPSVTDFAGGMTAPPIMALARRHSRTPEAKA